MTEDILDMLRTDAPDVTETEPDTEEDIAPTESADTEGDPFRAHFDALMTAVEELCEKYPDAHADELMHNGDFLRLTSPAFNMGAEQAYRATHVEALERRAEENAGKRLAAAFMKAQGQPREGGERTAAALSRADYRSMGAEGRAQLKAQIRLAASQGRKIYPN